MLYTSTRIGKSQGAAQARPAIPCDRKKTGARGKVDRKVSTVSEIGLSRNGFAIGKSNKPPGREKNGLDLGLRLIASRSWGLDVRSHAPAIVDLRPPPLSLSYRSWACISSAYKVHKMG